VKLSRVAKHRHGKSNAAKGDDETPRSTSALDGAGESLKVYA
jgi:hypothetical protein